MPQLTPGSAYTYIAPITISPSGISCEAELFLGPDDETKIATSGRVPFTSTGAEQSVRLPIVMPITEATYGVFVDVYAEGVLVAAARDIEDVVIAPAVAAVEIISAEWETLPYAGETFCKCAMSVSSDTSFIGTVKITCPYTISAVPLLTEAGRQRVLDEIDASIAAAFPGGATERLWINRKAIFLSYPQVDGFTLDFRWYASADPDSQNSTFRSWIGSMADSLTLTDVVIPAGTSTVYVGFFKLDGAALIHPATIELYRDEALVASVESTLVPPTGVPQLLGVSLPTSVVSGGDVSSTTVLRLPPQTNKSYYFRLSAIFGEEGDEEGSVEIAEAHYAPTAMVNTWSGRGCNPFFQPLNAPDNIYTIRGIWDRSAGVWTLGKAEYYVRRTGYVPLPSGAYPVSLTGESWRIGVPPTGCGIYYYGLGPTARYNFGQVGTLVVT